MDLPSS